MKENELLENLAKILGADNKFKELEEKRLKEKRMLESLGAQFGVKVAEEEERDVPITFIQQPAPVVMVEVVVEPEPIEEPQEIVEEVVESVIPVMPELPIDTMVTKSVEKIAKVAPKEVQKAVDEIPGSVRKEIDAVKKSITDLHRFAQRHSQMGGGGEVKLLRLDDVDATTVADGLYLRYDTGTGKLIFDTPSGGGNGSYTLPAANTTTLGGVKVDGSTITIASNTISANLTGYQTTSGLSANVATLTSNNSLYLGGVAANQYAYANTTTSQLVNGSLSVTLNTDGSVTFPSNRVDGGSNSISLWSSNQATVVWRGAGGAGLPLQSVVQSLPGYVNIGTATGILGGATTTYNWKFDTAGVMTFPDNTTQNTAWTGSVSTLTSNNSLYLDGVAANQYAYANSLTAYQTTTGLSANVATLTSNNTSYLGTIAANQYAYANGSNFSINNPLTVTYIPATATGYAITATGKDTQGGTGYFDFLRATNTTTGVTNGNKTFRLSSAGAIEIINSAYSATLMALSDAGTMSTALPYNVAGKQAVNGPAFSAYANNTLQTITSGSQQKVLFQVEEFDTNSNYASSRFTPTVEGYYQLNAEVRLDGASGTGEMMIILYKNGSEYKRGMNQSGTQIATSFWAMQVSSLVYANGTGDYFEIYVQQGSGGSVTVTAVNNPAITWFNGCMLRGA